MVHSDSPPVERDNKPPQVGLLYQLSEPNDVVLGRTVAVDNADLLPLLHVLGGLRHRHPTRNVMLKCAGRQRSRDEFGNVLGQYARALSLLMRWPAKRS